MESGITLFLANDLLAEPKWAYICLEDNEKERDFTPWKNNFAIILIAVETHQTFCHPDRSD